MKRGCAQAIHSDHLPGCFGVTKFRAGNGVAVGDFITCAASGFIIKCNSGYIYVGECVTAAASGNLGTALLRGKFYVASL